MFKARLAKYMTTTFAKIRISTGMMTDFTFKSIWRKFHKLVFITALAITGGHSFLAVVN